MTVSGEPKTVLLVEDDAATAELEKRVLAHSGLATHVVGGVKAAIALLEQRSFSVIVLDYNLPDGDAWTIADVAKRKQPRIPVVLVTAQGNEHIASEAIRREVADYVKKGDTFWDQLPGVIGRVTALAEAREALQAERTQLAEAQRIGQLGSWEWEISSNRVSWSTETYRIFGLQENSFDPSLQGFLERVHADDRQNVQAHLQQAYSDKQPFTFEHRIVLPNGELRALQARGTVIVDEHSQPVRMVGTGQDVTERRKVEAALRESLSEKALLLQELESREALLRQFITHTPAAIAMLDRDMCYVQASRRWLSDYKLHGQVIIGRSHYDVFPDIPQRWKDIHQRVLAGAVESCDEDPFPRADGRMEWLQWEARPWHDNNGDIGGLIFFTQVITERKELGMRLEEQNRQLERSNSELEQFAYVASHDLQEPLRAVAGCTQILAQRYRGRVGADADTLVEHIVDGAARMKALIEGLLSLSRVGAQVHAPSSVDVEGVLKQTLRNLDLSIKDHGARVDAGALPRVSGDEMQLLQLFQNLIGNALKYRREDPPMVTVTATALGNFQQFSISDNGIGIDPQYFDRIFGVFQRLHTREEYPGTGIGLAVCRKIVERHGGKLWLESIPSKGSTFHFTLPAERTAEKAAR